MRRPFLMAAGVTALSASILGAGVAQEAVPTVCVAAPYRQFDFWVGEWDVRDPDGVFQGTNRIVKIQSGCALQEFWKGAQGGTGTSLNAYDFTTGTWHQTWVSGSMLLLLSGQFRDGKMVLEGTTRGRNGATTQNRITWTPVSHDVVTQVWETSADGASWAEVFHGRYTRRPSSVR